MGVSTDGQICFGIVFEEGYEFPWDNDEDGEENWWIKKCGFVPPFEIYADTKTGYVNNIRPSQSDIDKYYRVKTKFCENHPLPFKLVNYCSVEYPMYMLAVPGTVKTNSRGDPTEFVPEQLVTDREKLKNFIEFCKEHFKDIEIEPKWYLSSYWG